ncbi:unnamed protein product [Oncorhynchus mykiss]|uniref:Transposase Tc1-like domain-containing protein n=1 Tax=Oncorhynchus mykiss TaxID=8022 RepID=A0A060VS63_ONCMY|nr:unnamed protein product [Oncorhynchus mykiss]
MPPFQEVSSSRFKRRLEWCKARRHWTLEQWKCVLWSDESGSPMDESGFCGCRENTTCPNA